nr:hypothetical protein FEE99_18765 [Pseudomonas sp. ef1]
MMDSISETAAMIKLYRSCRETRVLRRYLCRSCRRLRSFDLEEQNQKIAAFGSSYIDYGVMP